MVRTLDLSDCTRRMMNTTWKHTFMTEIGNPQFNFFETWLNDIIQIYNEYYYHACRVAFLVYFYNLFWPGFTLQVRPLMLSGIGGKRRGRDKNKIFIDLGYF